MIAQWRLEQAVEHATWFRKWGSSQVAGYRLELVLGYLGMMFFGWTAIVAGVPLFALTTPDPYGWAVLAGVMILVGGVIGGAGATRAGEEPVTRMVQQFNRAELLGTILLFLSVGLYAVSLLVYGYLINFDPGRQTIGAAMTALSIRPGVRMVWLIFHPGRVKESVIGEAIQSALSKRADAGEVARDPVSCDRGGCGNSDG